MIAVIVLLTFTSIQGQNVLLEEAPSFFPNSEMLNKEEIAWKYFSVPENWNDPNSNQIKIAVAVLKKTSREVTEDALVFIQGGPGASAIENLGIWLTHPLREKNDIVLFDIRGTGFSEPRLCPDLGKKFLEILAKNQLPEEDEKQKIAAVLLCKQSLLSRGVATDAYNSFSVAKDLNALKTELGYSRWNVYGASYGTHMAQIYASSYREDIKTLILDSSISDISKYYTQNTSNYMKSLSKVFVNCKNDINCADKYPNLENVYYTVISDLEKDPITVSVDKNSVDSEEFTYNVEDFKVAIQQALYNKKLIEVIPLLIYQFQERNEAALGSLVAAFSSLLSMDYGVYYCVSCNEALPYNSISEYNNDAALFQRLKGGLSFYKSDFRVCDKWNHNRIDSLAPMDISKLAQLSFPVLVLSGEYDPITPVENGKEIVDNFKNAYAITGYTYGHVPGFTRIGSLLIQEFINTSNEHPDINAYKKASAINFASAVTINPGISKVGESLTQFDLIFLTPLFIALLIMLLFIFIYIFRLVRKKYAGNPDKIIRISSVLTSIIGITGLIALVIALMEVSKQNYFVLAFGLPDDFKYVFTILLVFSVLLGLTLVYFITQIKKIQDRSIIFSVLFSNILLMTYFFYWGVV